MNAGIVALISIAGLGWLGSSFFEGNRPFIIHSISGVVQQHPWVFATRPLCSFCFAGEPGRDNRDVNARGYCTGSGCSRADRAVSGRERVFLPADLRHAVGSNFVRSNGHDSDREVHSRTTASCFQEWWPQFHRCSSGLCWRRWFCSRRKGGFDYDSPFYFATLSVSRNCSRCLAGRAACDHAPHSSERPSASDEWHDFQGTWTAAGSRHRIPLGDGRRASTAKFEGSLLLAGPSRPAVGFRAEALVLNDTTTGLVGRAVWTDDRGDQVFSELTGNGDSTGNKIIGRFVGDRGVTWRIGRLQLSWRFVLETEDGTVQGQSMGLSGTIHVGSAQAALDAGGPR